MDELRSSNAVYPLVVHGDAPLLLGRSSDDGARAPDVDLAAEADTRTVSREHLVLTPALDGWSIQVAPDTLNLTLVNGRRLLPGQEVTLRDQDTLQAGEVRLALHRVRLVSPDVIAVQLDSPELAISPGEDWLVKVAIENHTGREQGFSIAVMGLPDSWYRITLPGESGDSVRSAIQLPSIPPGSEPPPQQVSIHIQPPRTAASHAGVYAFQVLVTTEGRPALRGTATGELCIEPFEQATFTLTPDVQAGPSTDFYADFENAGNAPTSLSLTAEGEGLNLEYALLLAAEPLSVPAGTKLRVALRATVQRRHWMGAERSYLIIARAQVGEATLPLQQTQLVAPPHVPVWAQRIGTRLLTLLAPVLLLVLILLTGFLFVRPPDIHTFRAELGPGQRVTLGINIDRRCASLQLEPDALELRPVGGAPIPECSTWDRLVDGFPWAADTTYWEASGKLSAAATSYSVTAKNLLGVGSSRSVTVPGAQLPKILAFDAEPLRLSNETDLVNLSWTTQDANAIRLLRLDAPVDADHELRDLLAPVAGLSGNATDTLRRGEGEYILLAATVDELPADGSPALERIRASCVQEDGGQSDACVTRKRFEAGADEVFAQCKPKALRGEFCMWPNVVMQTLTVTVMPPEIVSFMATPESTSPGAPVELQGEFQGATSVKVRAKDPNAPRATLAQAQPGSVLQPAAASSGVLPPRPVVKRSLDGLDGGDDDAPTPTATPPQATTPAAATPRPAPAPPPPVTAPPIGFAACDRSGTWEVAASPFTLRVTPACDTEYELVATNAGGTTLQSVVVRASPIRINLFTAAPGAIPLGGEAVLSWSVDGASILELSTIGAVTGETSRVVKPEKTTDYVLIAYGRDRLGPSESKTVRVTVGMAPVQIDLFVASPATITAGANTTLSVSAQNARQVTITSSDGTVVFQQSAQPKVQWSVPVSPRQTTLYTLIVSNDSGSANAALVVTVLPPATATPTPTPTPTPTATPTATATLAPAPTGTPSGTATPVLAATGTAQASSTSTATLPTATPTPQATETPSPTPEPT